MRKKICETIRRLISGLICLSMTLSMVSSMGLPAFATSTGPESGGALVSAAGGPTEKIMADSRVADPNTMDTYLQRLLSNESGSRYAGRVWTDKTVFAFGQNSKDFNSSTLSLDMATDGYKGKVSLDADFLHVFSAIASSQVVNEYPPNPIDLVIVFDMSGSMGQDTRYGIDAGGNSYQAHDSNGDSETNKWPAEGVIMSDRIEHSRIQATLDAINETIDSLMAQNPQN